MTSLAVTGYASVDYAVGLSGTVRGDHTTLIDFRDPENWPRIGGCPAYVAAAVAAQGRTAAPVSWVGNDNHARIYLESLVAANVGTDGVARLGRKSPMAILAYQRDGSCVCLFDPAFAGTEELTSKQREIIGTASCLCITVGPPHLMETILAARPQAARLYWICKNDAHCFTPAIRRTLSAQADVIFRSRSERELISKTSKPVTIVETQGREGIAIFRGGKSEIMSTEPIDVRDTTGAGDTFAGGYIAAEMAGTADPLEAAQAGIAAVRDMLERRSIRER